jgi:hypothetical protein
MIRRKEEVDGISDTISPHDIPRSDPSTEDQRFRETLDAVMGAFGPGQRICIAREMIYDSLSGRVRNEYRIMVPLLSRGSTSFISFEDALASLLPEA